jgi:hypothetical protein
MACGHRFAKLDLGPDASASASASTLTNFKYLFTRFPKLKKIKLIGTLNEERE